MPAPRNVIQAINEDMRLQNRLYTAIARDSSRFRNALTTAFTNRIQNVVTDDAGRLLPGMVNESALEITNTEIRQIMREAGVGEYAQKVSGHIKTRARTANRLYNKIGLKEAVIPDLENMPFVAERIESTANRIAAGVDHVAESVERSMHRFRDQMAQGQTVTRRQLVDDMTAKAGISPAHGFTVSTTEMSAADREIKAEQTAKAGVENMKYLGPDDRVTRPWCAEHLNEVRPITYWQMAENDTGPNPPLQYGGGYNCRHRLITWLPEWD